VLSRSKLDEILRTLPRLTIGLVGDLFLDRYLHFVPGSRELSIETGLEAYQVEHVRNSPGALGTVMNNLAALGVGLLVPVTAIGDDGHGFDLLRQVRRLPVDIENILCLPERLTPTYTKPLRIFNDGNAQELNRLDVRTRAPLSLAATGEICRRLEKVFRTSDGLIVLDQVVDEGCGVVSASVRECLEGLARETPGKLIFVDSRRFLGRFHFGVLKGNRSEVLAAAAEISAGDKPAGNALRGVPGTPNDAELAGHGMPQRAFPTEDDAVREAVQQLALKTNRPAFCTIGERGIAVARSGQNSELVLASPVNGPIDIVGAGDAASSGIVAALLAGADELEAAALGNLVASITIRQLGATGTATPEQVRARYEEIS
jgi:bifunctional ADP-heptose synthase (sugar kinase/adenylyltransferase)